MREDDDHGPYTREIQANILGGLDYPHARFLFVEFLSAELGRAWLRDLAVTHGGAWAKKPDSAATIAFTHGGLAALGVPGTILSQFPKDFCEGMRKRRAYTGDADNGSSWDNVFRLPIHALVSLYGKNAASLDAWVDRLCDGHAVKKLDVQPAARLPQHKEHFGFRDGISQPVHHDAATGGWRSDVPIDQFLVFPKKWNDGKSAKDDPGLALGLLGTYLVLRKLEQHVDRFLRFAQGWAFGPELVAAKMIGRWPNGTPVTAGDLSPDRRKRPSNANRFDFKDDRDGHKCPIGAHISRVNPRERLPVTAGQHRILRRGIPYGPAVDLQGLSLAPAQVSRDERGLVFIALNASIEDQFEFVQRNWVNEPSFNGLDGVDPIAHSSGPPRGNFRFERGGAFQPLLQDFVELRGGEYFFVPSMAALKSLAGGDFSGS